MIKLEIYLLVSIKHTAGIVGRLAAGKIGHECQIRKNVTGMRVSLSASLFVFEKIGRSRSHDRSFVSSCPRQFARVTLPRSDDSVFCITRCNSLR